MNIIFKIAKNEVRYLFYSPIAWFVLIVFLVQCAIYYTLPIYGLANAQDILEKNSASFIDFGFPITFTLFSKGPLFGSAIQNLYWYIPILTMGLIGREINDGSIKILYSSPITLRQIVLGKYLGILLFNILLVSVLSIFLAAAIIQIDHVDYGMLLSAALGFYLLVALYSAIGLFMSTLSTYPIVSALCTFIALFVLTNIGGWLQRYDIVRDLTYFLSFQNRTGKMLRGLIVSRDVIYFILVSFLFVAFTLIKLKNGRDDKSWFIKAGRYLGVIALVLFLGYFCSRPTLTAYVDATAVKRNTVRKEIQQLIKEFGNDTLEITLYSNLLSSEISRGLPELRNAEYLDFLWEPYLRFKPDIQFKYEYYYDNVRTGDDLFIKNGSTQNLKPSAQLKADALDYPVSFFKSPEEIQKVVDMETESREIIMQLKYKGRVEWLRTYPGSGNFEIFWPDRVNVSAAFKRLLHPDKIPKVYFVTGEWERNILSKGDREIGRYTASKSAKNGLVNIGYDVDTLNLNTQSIPTDIWALVLADPKTVLSPVVQTKLTNYVDNGGNLMVLGEPNKQDVLNPLLQQLGIQFMPGQLVEPTYDETPDKIRAYLTTGVGKFSPRWSEFAKKVESFPYLISVTMPGAVAIDSIKNNNLFNITPLLIPEPEKAWLKLEPFLIDSTLPPFNGPKGDVKRASFTTGVLLTRQLNRKEQRILVFGDADHASNERHNEKDRLPFIMGCYGWLTNNEFPVTTSGIPYLDKKLSISGAAAKLQKTLFIYVFPALLLVMATVLLIRRRRK